MIKNHLKKIDSNKKIAMTFAADGNYAFCLYVSLVSFFKHSPKLAELADIFIFAHDMSDSDKQILSFNGKIHVMDYDFPFHLERTHSVNKFSIVSFARYECFNMLSKYEKIMYLDCDILVQKELLPAFDFIDEIGIGMIPEKVNVDNFCEHVDEYDENALEFNSGFILLSSKLCDTHDCKAIADFCYAATMKYVKKLNLPDQAIINLACQKFKIKPHKLSNVYNTPASLSRKTLRNALIIHSLGARKFWNYYYFDEWYEYYNQWIKMGGVSKSARSDSEKYKKFCIKYNLDKKVFFQLCPDFF